MTNTTTLHQTRERALKRQTNRQTETNRQRERESEIAEAIGVHRYSQECNYVDYSVCVKL